MNDSATVTVEVEDAWAVPTGVNVVVRKVTGDIGLGSTLSVGGRRYAVVEAQRHIPLKVHPELRVGIVLANAKLADLAPLIGTRVTFD